MPVIPATQEAEAGESLEPGRWRLQGDCATAWATDSVSKKKTNKQTKNTIYECSFLLFTFFWFFSLHFCVPDLFHLK